MASPDDRRYLATHEWHKLEGNVVTIGLSQFAVDELTDLTYLEITAGEGPVDAGQALGEIDSVKATSEIYTGMAGRVIEVNQQALDDPAIINQDPWEQGWIARIEVDDPTGIESLMTSDQYDQTLG